MIALSTIPFAQAEYYSPGRPFGDPNTLILHTSQTAERPGAGLALQATATNNPRRTSWHFTVGASGVYQSVRASDRAWAAGPLNDRGIHIEIIGSAFQTAAQWQDPFSRATLDHLAQLLAALSVAHRIPLLRLSVEGLLAGHSGAAGHHTVSLASQRARAEELRFAPWWTPEKGWRETDHTDPGEYFVWSVLERAARLAAGPPSAPPFFPPTPLSPRAGTGAVAAGGAVLIGLGVATLWAARSRSS